MEKLFNDCTTKASLLNDVAFYYNELLLKNKTVFYNNEWNKLNLPIYIINLPERIDRRKHIELQFEGRSEFSINVMEAIKHQIGAVGLWLSIRKIIEMAIANDDDVIVICEDDHEFTKDYSKEYLIRNIIEAHKQGADLLSGGTAILDTAVPITHNRFWINAYYSTQFIVVYRKFYQKILDEPFDDNVVADRFLSKMTANKMILYPFISTQKDFGYSDCTSNSERPSGTLENLFIQSGKRLENIQKAYKKYNQ